MSWAVLNTEDVLSEFTFREADSIKLLQSCSGSGSGSGCGPYTNFDIIVARAIDEVRGFIQAGGYTLDAVYDNTIPVGLFADAIALARWRILISAPMLKQLQTEERKQAYSDAIKKLMLIAQQQFSVESPTPDTNPRTGNWNSECKLIMRTHPVPQPGVQFPDSQGNWANITFPSTPPIIVGEVPTGLINSSNQNYTTAYGFSMLFVYLNGVRMKLSVDYTITGSNAFHFLYAPTTGDTLLVDYVT